jgi:tetratricopeptide (TPR) repeat protein
VTEQSEHLSNAQVENYGKRTSDAGAESAQRDEPQRVDDRRFDDQRPKDQHVQDQGIGDQVVDDQRVDDQRLDDQRVEAHLADCPSCRNRLFDFHRAHFAMLAGPAPDAKRTDSALVDSKFANSKYPVQAQMRTAPTPECPSDDDLRQLAAGLSPDALGAKLTQHAATCDHCGPLLRSFTEDFSEEQAALASLQSSSHAWQKNTARRMLEAGNASVAAAVSTAKSGKKSSAERPTSSALDRKPFFWKWILVPATAAVVTVAAFSIWYTQRDTPEKVGKLLAQAYTEQRNMEMRIPYAKHSEFHQLRSGDASSLLRLPVPLRKAADGIATQLRTKPDDPEWLLLSARLDLLDWRYKSALSTLEKIEDKTGNHQAEIEMERAMALYQRAEFESDQPEAYGQAVDILAKVLQRTPDDRVALHNQAVACEKAHMYECALADWDHLSHIEQDPDWSKEAREHLDHLQEKKSLAPKP